MIHPEWVYDIHFLGGVDVESDDDHVTALIDCLTAVPDNVREWVLRNVTFLHGNLKTATLIVQPGLVGSIFSPHADDPLQGDIVIRIVILNESVELIARKIAKCFLGFTCYREPQSDEDDELCSVECDHLASGWGF